MRPTSVFAENPASDMAFFANHAFGPASGVQSLGRAFGLLELIGRHHLQGLTSQELAQQSGLDRTTLHRLLTFLSNTQYLQREEQAPRRWHLGNRCMGLGMTSMTRPPLVETLSPTMKSLARQTADAVFLVTRMGDFSYTLHLEQGANTPAGYAHLVGASRLLGLGTGSTAMLAMLPEEELAAHLARHQPAYTANHFNPLKLQRGIQRTRKLGYTLAAEANISGAGVAFDYPGFGLIALSILSSRARMPLSRRHEVANLLLHEIAVLTRQEQSSNNRR